jgi:hypothetical protein
MMGKTYQSALEVLVWLGLAADAIMQAMTAMKSLHQHEIQKHQHALSALSGVDTGLVYGSCKNSC